MSDQDIVAVVADATYAKGELERDLAITDKLFELTKMPFLVQDKTKSPKEYRQRIVNVFISREVLLNEAKRRNVQFSPLEMKDYQNQFAADLSQNLTITFDALLNALGRDATAFRNNLKNDAVIAKLEQIVRKELSSRIAPPTKGEAEKVRREAIAFNQGLPAATRSLARLATNAWKSIRAGNDFAVVGRKLPDMRKEISFDSDYQDNGRFSALPAGTLTPPAAVDGGIEFAKIGQSADGRKTCARLFFEFPKPRPERSVEETLQDLTEQAVSNAYSDWFKNLKAASKISTAAL